MSENRRQVLAMLAEGKITVEQAEEMLNALDAAGNSSQAGMHQEYDSGKSNKPPIAEELSKFTGSVHQKLREAVRKVEPQSRELKTRLKEFGSWMQNMIGSAAAEFTSPRNQDLDGVEIDVDLPEPAGFNLCKNCRIENLFGSVRVTEGDKFTLRMRGNLSRSALGEKTPTIWFAENAFRIDGDTAVIGVSRNVPIKAVLEMELTLPQKIVLNIETDSAPVRIAGDFSVGKVKTVSGDVATRKLSLENGEIETVSGNVSLEGGTACGVIKTISGNVILKDVKLFNIQINTISGDILIADPDLDNNAAIVIETASGDIAIERPQGNWSRVDVGTRTGEMGLRWRGVSYTPNNIGEIIESGVAGATFKISSTSGDIILA